MKRIRHELEIRSKLPKANRLVGRSGSRWEKVKWTRLFESCLVPIVPPSRRCAGPARLAITRVLGPRERAFDSIDNFRTSLKPLIDALRYAGYIKGDEDRWLPDPVLLQVKEEEGRNRPGPIIRVIVEYDDAREGAAK